ALRLNAQSAAALFLRARAREALGQDGFLSDFARAAELDARLRPECERAAARHRVNPGGWGWAWFLVLVACASAAAAAVSWRRRAREAPAGERLRELLRGRPERRICAEAALEVLGSICAALASDGGAPRAVEPGRILLARGRVVLLDLGEGSAPYLAPEAESGRPGPESEAFSLAVCLYEMLTGSLPFAGAELSVDKRLGRFAPASRAAAGLPAGIDAFFSRALHPEPSGRFRSSEELLRAFRSVVVPAVE
ncbi:MAG: hypothetical protein PHF00_03250, partial [Elusimicrobia bacterium]|nr:hypothetical protein [Elusimicrobiota bacterium]